MSITAAKMAVFSIFGALPPVPNFAKIHARGGGGRLVMGDRDQRPPWGAQTSPEQSGKADCGGRLSPGRGRRAHPGRGATRRGRAAGRARAAKAARGHTLGGPIRARRAVFRAARAHVGGGTGPGPGRRASKRSEFAGGPGEKALFTGADRGGGGARLLQAASFPGGL